MFVPGAGPSGAVTWGTSGLNMGGGTLSGATWAGSTISMTYGGTNASLTATAGASVYSTGTALALSAAGTSGQLLTSGGSGAPTWTSASTLTVAAATTASTATSVTGGYVSSAVAGTGVSVSAATGAVTISIGQAVATSSNVQFNSLGVNTAGSGTAGEIRATNNITAYYSDERLKTKVGNIDNALYKVTQIETMLYHANETAVALGYDASIMEVGVTAQSVQQVQPEVVVPAPIDDQYLTVRYEKLVPLLIEAIKELKAEIDALKGK